MKWAFPAILTIPLCLATFLFSRITGPFIIKENADTGLKNVCCGDSWQITAHRTQFYSPGLAHRHWSWPTFLSFTPIPGDLLQQKADLSLIMISVLSHYLFDKEKIVLSSNKTEFSSPFERGGRGDQTNFPKIPPKMPWHCGLLPPGTNSRNIYIYAYAPWTHIKAPFRC